MIVLVLICLCLSLPTSINNGLGEKSFFDITICHSNITVIFACDDFDFILGKVSSRKVPREKCSRLSNNRIKGYKSIPLIDSLLKLSGSSPA